MVDLRRRFKRGRDVDARKSAKTAVNAAGDLAHETLRSVAEALRSCARTERQPPDGLRLGPDLPPRFPQTLIDEVLLSDPSYRTRREILDVERRPAHPAQPLRACVPLGGSPRDAKLASEHGDEIVAKSVVANIPEAGEKGVDEIVLILIREAREAQPRQLQKIAQDIVGDKIAPRGFVGELEIVRTKPGLYVAHHPEIVIRNDVADGIAEQHASLHRASLEQRLDRDA